MKDGEQRLAWVSIIHPFGTVEVIERTPWFDVGPNRRGRDQRTWLVVCMEPNWLPYTGSLAIVREFKTGQVFVLSVDNYNVLYEGGVEDGEQASYRGASGEVLRSTERGEGPKRGRCGEGVEGRQEGRGPARGMGHAGDTRHGSVHQSGGAPNKVRSTVLTHFVFRLTSAALGDGYVETDKGGMITRGTGEYGAYFLGMQFREFVRGWKRADRRAKYSQVAGSFNDLTGGSQT